MIYVLEEGASVPDQASDAPGAVSRPRRAKGGGRAPVLEMDAFDSPGVTSATELSMLKISLSEMIGIPVGQQELFYKGRLLEPDSATLAACRVPRNAEIYIKRNRDGNDDFAAGFAEPSCASRRRAAGPELGFAGTGLSSAPRRPAAAVAAAAAAGVSPVAAPGAAVAGSTPPALTPTSSAAAAAPVEEDRKQSPKTWTFENETSASACLMCETARA
jgi:hypothetical protein